MADTALTIITDALLDLGVLADEETPSASQAVGGLRKLNNMIDAWNIDTLMVYGSTQYVFPLTGGDGQYTLGPGGDFSSPRPNNLIGAYLRDTSLPAAQQLDYKLYMMNEQEYADITLKGLTGVLPQAVFIDDSFPLANVYLFGIPSTSQYSLVLWDSGLISNFSLNTVISLAPGYKRALTSNLVIELAPSYGIEPSNAVAKIAQESMSALKIVNLQLNELEIDSRLTRTYFNYLTGDMQ